jgi:hypothetical protein
MTSKQQQNHAVAGMFAKLSGGVTRSGVGAAFQLRWNDGILSTSILRADRGGIRSRSRKTYRPLIFVRES